MVPQRAEPAPHRKPVQRGECEHTEQDGSHVVSPCLGQSTVRTQPHERHAGEIIPVFRRGGLSPLRNLPHRCGISGSLGQGFEPVKRSRDAFGPGLGGASRQIVTSGLSTLNEDQIAERGARMARRDDREYREYLREEQRRQPGCPAREVVLDQRGQATRRGVLRSRRARALLPRRAASPTPDRRAGCFGAPRSSRNLTISSCPNFAAQASGVERRCSSRAVRSAPASSSFFAFAHIAVAGRLVERRDAQPVVRARWPVFTRVSLRRLSRRTKGATAPCACRAAVPATPTARHPSFRPADSERRRARAGASRSRSGR